MLDDMHTLGRKSFAILRHELRQQDPDKQEPSQAKVCRESRKRSSGIEGHTKLAVKKKKRTLPKWMLWSLPKMKMVITATTLTTK